MAPRQRKVAFHTLGCPKNFVDSEALASVLRGAGIRCVKQPHRADVLIVNTCGFLDDAKVESVEILLEAVHWKQAKPGRQVLAMGCLTQSDRREIAESIPELDGVFGIGEWTRILECIGASPVATNGYRERFLDCTAPAGPASAYLRVSDGCSHACAFCSIPRMRGFYRSEPLDRLLDQARVLAARGVKEIILIGQETTSYGVDIYGRRRIVELCSRLSDNDGLEWIRILYAHAPTISPRLVRELARVPKLVPYLDYPIEHASDRILRRMNRRVTAARMKDTIAAFRDVLPDACVRSTVLVGFPGETNEDFEKLFEFVREVRFERLGVFVYSPQEGTAGAVLDGQVEEGIALDRLDRLMNLQRAICREKHRSLVKRVLPVLVERSARGISWGRSAWDAPEIDGKVRIAGGVTPGQIVNVCVTRAHAYHVEAVVVAERNDLRERKLCGCSGRSALSRP